MRDVGIQHQWAVATWTQGTSGPGEARFCTQLERSEKLAALVPPLLDLTNLYMDATDAQKELIVWRRRKWGINKLLFGSDYLSFATTETPADAISTLKQFPFTPEEIDAILSNDGSAWLYGQP